MTGPTSAVLSKMPLARRGRGFFAIGIYGSKTPENLGTLWRSASLYAAAFVFTVGKRYKRQASDTMDTASHVPLFHYSDVDDLVAHLPHACPMVGVELDPRAIPLARFDHPQRGCYLLGAEDHGLSTLVIDRCHALVQVEAARPWSMNVASAGAVLLYDRYIKALANVPAVTG
jgi:tRNA G18 (ribose-2'-O)-methylase SpoU